MALHDPSAARVVHTFIGEPLEHVAPFVHVVPVPPPPWHAEAAEVSACVQSPQVLHWNESPLSSL